ncbi:MAG TPA: protein kinase [Gemmataceae bacterium]|jgi:WD40 repeat protein/tRNA A-37 threonylcarbamoyl transferase component Bud32|nr:protein kinase [Gemmataceae bacterium]
MMAVTFACPDVQVLQQLALGQMPPEEVERLAEHCERCERCIRVLHTLKAEDTLVEAMAAQRTTPDRPREAAVDVLIERLRQAPPAAPDAGLTTTSADTPLPPLNARPPAEQTQDVYDFLAPPEGPGETGRLGGYRVLKVLGQGGMGVVFLAEDVRLKRKVALKVMKPDLAAKEAARRRFLREAEATAAVKSDHVVTIYQVGEDRGAPFLAMELLEGMPLDRWLHGGRKPTVAQVLRLGREIVVGLAAAHERGLIHRDVKPANIWIEAAHGGRVKLLDFGLARAAADDTHLTQSGAIVGTPAYMAPEQARGEQVDHRSDLFSLGCVLYLLCTGRNAFPGTTTMAVLASLAMHSPQPVNDLNPEILPVLADLVMQLLAKDPAGRPPSAQAVAEALQSVERSLPGRVAAAAAPSVTQPAAAALPQAAPPRRRRRRLLAVAAGLLATAALVAAIIVIVRDRQGNKVAEISVPEGGSVELKDDGKVKDDGKERPTPKADARIAAAPLGASPPGEPVSSTALVQHPARLPGVRSWTIETRSARGQVKAVAYRPGGKLLATGGDDGTIRLWDPATGQLVRMLVGNPVLSLSWSPNGKILAGGGSLWEADTGRLLHRSVVQPWAAWAPQGRTLAHWWGNGLLLWNATTERDVRGHVFTTNIQWLAWSPDAKTIAIGLADKTARLWDVASGKETKTLKGHEGTVTGLAWSPDGKLLVTGAEGGNAIHVWDAATGKLQGRYVVEQRGISAIAWSPDGKAVSIGFVVSHGMFDPDTGRLLRSFEAGQGVFAWAWSPDGKEVATVSNDAVRLHDAATGKLTYTLEEPITTRRIQSLVWSPDSRRLALGRAGDDPRLLVVEAATGRRCPTPAGAFHSAAWSPDGKTVAAMASDHSVGLWDAVTTRPVRTLECGVRGSAPRRGLAWSPDGKTFAAGEGQRLWAWSAETGKLLWQNDKHGSISALVWSPDSRLLATADATEKGTVRLWEADTGRLLHEVALRSLGGLAWSPDGKTLAVPHATSGSQYCLIDTASWRVRATLRHGEWAWPDIRWSSDGKTVITFGESLRVWDSASGKQLRAVHLSHLPYVTVAGWSPDGHVLALSNGYEIRLIDKDGHGLGVLLPGEPFAQLAVTADGHYRGNARVEREIMMVVQKRDGTSETLTPVEFERKYGFHNARAAVRLTE